MPARPMMMAPVGKSGPLMYCISSSSDASGWSIRQHMPSMTSPILCGGMFVAMPTAMPVDPLTKRFGKWLGSTTGSFRRSS